ncbi:MAG: hypothetical protein ACLQLO_01580, partial [Mycobacterium sp.]
KMHQRCPLSSQHAHIAVDVSAERRASNPADTLNHRCGVREPFDDTVTTDIPLAAATKQRPFDCGGDPFGPDALTGPVLFIATPGGFFDTPSRVFPSG